MIVLVAAPPADPRLAPVMEGLQALGVQARHVARLKDLPDTDGAVVVVIDQGDAESLRAVHLGSRRGGASRPVVTYGDLSAQGRRSQLLAVGAARQVDQSYAAERLAAEARALGEPAADTAAFENQRFVQNMIAITVETFSMMLNSKIRHERVERRYEYVMPGEITAMINLAGREERMLALNTSLKGARGMAIAFLQGMVEDPDQAMISDSVGEMVNIIAGQLKAVFSGTALAFDIGMPSVVVGTSHEIRHRAEMPCQAAHFTSDFGPFFVQLCTRPHEG